MHLIYRKRYRLLLELLPRPAVHRPLNRIAWRLIQRRVAKAGCWFIDLPRTSSNATWEGLWQEFGWPFNSKFGSGYHSFLPGISPHCTARDIRMSLGSPLWQKIFTFSIVRNPWDRYLSLFFYELHLNATFRMQYIPDDVRLVFKRWLTGQLPGHFVLRPAEAYLLDEDGNMLVDFVAKYENRQAELAYIGKKIHCPKLGQEQRLVEFTPKAYHYSEYYDSELRDFVAEVAKWEIEKFNYSFEQPSAQAESRQWGGGGEILQAYGVTG